jgi:hypothetical protein
MNHVLCDGGLCNRLNALIFALVLRRRFGHDWQVSWPRNNWCDSPLDRLFTCQLPFDDRPVAHYQAASSRMLGALHENQVGFAPGRFVFHKSLSGYGDYARLIEEARAQSLDFVYYNNLLPAFVTDDDVCRALELLQIEPGVAARTQEFVLRHGIDANTIGVHIRKTDFGDAVDDRALFEQVRTSPSRFFVCSDDAEVNQRFAQLPNCAVYEKTALPGKLDAQGAWQHWITDTDGRRYPFNVNRSEAAVVDALVDLLILSKTKPLPTSGSTFLATAKLFGRCRYFQMSGEASGRSAERPVIWDEFQQLLGLLQPRALLDDLLVRAGPQGDGGWSLPTTAFQCETLLRVGSPDACVLDPAFAGRGARVKAPADIGAAVRSVPPDGLSLLMVDTKGAEWADLVAAGPADLDRFAVICVSLHGLDALVGRPFFDRASAAVKNLTAGHTVVDIRPSESGGRVLMGRRPFPRVVQLTLVRNRGRRFGELLPDALTLG